MVQEIEFLKICYRENVITLQFKIEVRYVSNLINGYETNILCHIIKKNNDNVKCYDFEPNLLNREYFKGYFEEEETCFQWAEKEKKELMEKGITDAIIEDNLCNLKNKAQEVIEKFYNQCQYRILLNKNNEHEVYLELFFYKCSDVAYQLSSALYQIQIKVEKNNEVVYYDYFGGKIVFLQNKDFDKIHKIIKIMIKNYSKLNPTFQYKFNINKQYLKFIKNFTINNTGL